MILGAAGGRPVSIALDRLIESRLLVQGTSGSGVHGDEGSDCFSEWEGV